jgi:hypothetical protein
MAVGATAGPGGCGEGQSLESLGRVDAAEAAYLRELENPVSVACARQGLARLGQRQTSCAYAAALDGAGERSAAHTAYLKALAANPTSQCAGRG